MSSALSAPPVVAEPIPTDRRSLARSAALLSVAWVTANAASYLLSVVGSRQLGPSGYGELGPMLAVVSVVGVPGLALQAVVARRTARGETDGRRAVTLGAAVGVVCAVVLVAFLPLLSGFLRLGAALPGLAAALVFVLPQAVLSSAQGRLQGANRFGALSVLVLGAGAARLFGGVVPLLLGASAQTTMLGVLIATAVVAVIAGAAPARRRPAVAGSRGAGSGMAGSRAAGRLRRLGWREVGVATVGLGGLLLLGNLDLLLARHLLGSSGSGHYATAAVIARVALWLPQAVSLTVLPRLTDSRTRGSALRDAALATAVVGALGVAVTAAAGGPLVTIAFGSAYRSLGGVAWMFAAQGGALAIVQLLIVDDIARARRGMLPVLAAAAVGETVALELTSPSTVGSIVFVAMLTAVAAAVVAAIRLSREPGGLAGQWPASSQVRPRPTETSRSTSSL